MGKWEFSPRSLREMKGIHPKLRKIADLAIQYSELDFIVTDGKRTIAEQRAYVRKGASKTMRSKHLTGRALDFVSLVDGRISWESKPMTKVAKAFKKASKELGIPIVWGGDWRGSWDKPHIELGRTVK
jgi:peptidoglycan L-alanyl-D-glutamate endopeptidase CwlK